MAGGISASFDVTPSGSLESFLSQSASSGLFSALTTGSSSAASATTTALKTGGLTNSEHNVISTIASGPTKGTSIQWNKNGSEPTTLANLVSYGWIKLVGKSHTDGSVSGTYTLTAVGKAIAARTGGGKVGSTGSSSSATSDGVSAATKQALTQGVEGVEELLAGLGGSSSSSGSISTSNTNASVASVLGGSSNASALNILA